MRAPGCRVSLDVSEEQEDYSPPDVSDTFSLLASSYTTTGFWPNLFSVF